MLDGLLDFNPLAIIHYDMDDVERKNGTYVGRYECWLTIEIIEYLEWRNYGRAVLIEFTENEIWLESKNGIFLVAHERLWFDKE
ncbi:hypothetical protein CSV80_06590 [Sporosarcina sp. P12(2017)]|uniref:hypothetical protein n=1 Tax=unclassified Sporosarcina TaxID=2647733 RepID=UPI000C1683D7|nr:MULTISPECIES: hypothetical protein [unclassified Sporosarcina]PIC57969.1 hypothetical protein CSV81_06735 [Sporosarcina sp. P10]PIC61352.1 hypothetical protein CSV80_06590 [Sporosarcina sp. P12(2017)]